MGEAYVHLCPLLRCYTWDGWVLEDPSIEKVHDVEVGSDDRVVLTET